MVVEQKTAVNLPRCGERFSLSAPSEGGERAGVR